MQSLFALFLVLGCLSAAFADVAVLRAPSFNITEAPRGLRAGWLDLEREGLKEMPAVKGLTGGGQLGVDISQPLSQSTAECMVKDGYGSVLIPRAYLSYGQVDTAACGSIDAGISAGFKTVGAYMFPCPSCGSASAQVQSLVDYLNGCSAFQGTIWLDIEGEQYWLGDSTKNRDWYQDLVDACNRSGFSCGVYASYSQWQSLFGSVDYQYGSNLPLWYAHYDGTASFADWEGGLSFGGFTPYAKQYQGDQSLCSFGVDYNYYPH
jgi:hypothetical protein